MFLAVLISNLFPAGARSLLFFLSPSSVLPLAASVFPPPFPPFCVCLLPPQLLYPLPSPPLFPLCPPPFVCPLSPLSFTFFTVFFSVHPSAFLPNALHELLIFLRVEAARLTWHLVPELFSLGKIHIFKCWILPNESLQCKGFLAHSNVALQASVCKTLCESCISKVDHAAKAMQQDP